MQIMWLLGGLGLGAGLMYLLDPEKGAERRDVLRGHVADYGDQTGALWDDTRRTLGQQAQAGLARTSMLFIPQPGLGERRRRQAEERSLPLGLCLLGWAGLGAGLVYLLEPQGGPQRRARLRETMGGYWHTAATTHTPEQELRRAWHFYQGRDLPRVDAHTRQPARAQAWYAEPADYESDVLYSAPFATRAEAEAWASAEAQRQSQEHTEI